jgi:hypothetical protein
MGERMMAGAGHPPREVEQQLGQPLRGLKLRAVPDAVEQDHLGVRQRVGEDRRGAEREQAAQRVPGDHEGRTPVGDQLRHERVELREHRAVVERPGLRIARQVHRDRPPVAGAEEREQRPPGVRRVAPAVQEHEPGAVALELQHAGRAARRARRVLDEWLHAPEGTLTM